MRRGIAFRLSAYLLALGIVAALSLGVYRTALGQAMAQVRAQGLADLALAEDRLTARLRRYQELAVMMSGHPSLAGLRAGGARDEAEAFLRSAADKTAALGLAYVSAEGRVLAAAGAPLGEAALTGRWTQRAQRGALGTGHAFLPRAGAPPQRAYFFAAPEYGPGGGVAAVLLVAVDMDEVEFGWRSSRPAVFFTDAEGRIFISNRSELLHARFVDTGAALERADGVQVPIAARQSAGGEVWELDLGPYIARRGLHLARSLPVIGMRAEALVDVAPAERLARLQAMVFAALCVAFGAILILLTERRRALVEANRGLEARVEARTGELRRAQAELVQAGKLSALGQMSAGISHELNQPLMAIQQFADNGRRFLARGKGDVADENLGRISELSARAARIIRNLRAFARGESEPHTRVDLGAVIGSAVDLTAERLGSAGVTLEWEPPQEPIFVSGGEVRLGQVFVNLLSNAADAMSDQAGARRIEITIAEGDKIGVSVRDTGPGIADPEKIFEPFYTTKEVSDAEGMGLGLSISYGLVQSFGGQITGRNATGGGAEFTVTLERWSEDGAAREAAE